MGACVSTKQGVIIPDAENGRVKSWVNHDRGVTFAWESSNGIIRMSNCDKNNALQSVLQVLIRVRPVMNFFMCEQMTGKYGKFMNDLLAKAYLPKSAKGMNKFQPGFLYSTEEE
jgi:hypothetical protein